MFNVLTDKHMLASFSTNIISLASLVGAYLIAYTFNKMEPQELNNYPNYLFVYLWHHWMPQISFLITVIVYYGRHQALCTAVAREINELAISAFGYSPMIEPIQ